MSKLFVLCVVCLVMLAMPIHAGLVATVNTDTITNLSITWHWDPEAVDVSAPALTHWFAQLDIANSYDVTALAYHLAPGPCGEDQNGFAVTFSFSFNGATDYGLLFDGSAMRDHGNNPYHVDADHYTFAFDRSALPANTTITLTGQHVPEPQTYALFGIAAALLAGYRRFRK